MFNFLSSFLKPKPNNLVQPVGDSWNGLRDPMGAPQQPGMEPQQPGIMDRIKSFANSDGGEALGDMFTGWAMGSTPQESLAFGAKMMASGNRGRRDDARRNQTVDWLESQGMSRQEAEMLNSNGPALTEFLKQRMRPVDPKDALQQEKLQLEIQGMKNPQAQATDDIREYQFAVQNGMFNGSFTDWQTKGVKDQDATFGREQGLRKEYIGTPEFKRFDDVRASYERVRASAQRQTGAGDLGTIFGFMKMLDPGSVVREGEFANAENSAGVPDRIRNLYNRVMAGERLTPEQRQEFVRTADDLYAAEQQRIRGLNERYSGIAGQYQLDPNRIVIQPPTYEPMNFGSVPTPGQVVDGYRFKGGDPSDESNWEKVQ